MTATHHTTAEIAKLARVLELPDPADLAFLADLPPAAIRAFRDQVNDLISRRDARRMQRIGAAAKLIPAPIAAKITEAAFGPVLAAAVAGSVDPARAVAIAGSLSPSFLADATVTLDPHRAAEVITHVPSSMAAAVARELIRRGDYLTMGRLVGSVPDSALRAALPHAADIDLLHVGYYLENTSAADRLLTLVADRIPGMLRATHTENQWPEAITLLDLLGPAERSRIGDIAADQDDEVIDGLLTAVGELDAWDTLLPVAAGMTPTALQRLTQRPLLHTPEALTTITDTALTHDLWSDLLPLAAHLTPTQLQCVAARVGTESDESLTALIEQAHTDNQWETLLPVALAFDTPTRNRLAALPILHRPDTLEAAFRTTATHNLWPQALPLLDALPTETHDTLAARIGTLSDDQFHAAATASPTTHSTPTLLTLILRQAPAPRTRSMTLLNETPKLEVLVTTLTTTDPAFWKALSDIRTEIPQPLRGLLAAQVAQCGLPEIGDQLTA